jgi:endogenous inhibitor of DNA gyrase (YacG/DUF329 family)
VEPIKIKKCPNCGREVRTRNKKKKYCSVFCQKRMAAIWVARNKLDIMLSSEPSNRESH